MPEFDLSMPLDEYCIRYPILGIRITIAYFVVIQESCGKGKSLLDCLKLRVEVVRWTENKGCRPNISCTNCSTILTVKQIVEHELDI